jgi:DNA-binding MarR family transcriptional regulator
MRENDPLSDQVFHELLSLMRVIRQYARTVIDQQGIKPRDMSVLLFISEQDTVTVSQVQHFIHHSPSTTSTLIANLEEAGFVTRTRSQSDNRVVLVSLTPQGHDLVKRLPLGGLPLLRRELQTLPADRLVEMLRMLEEIQQLMTGQVAE